MNSKIDLFGGTGFIGTKFLDLYGTITHLHDREDNVPLTGEYENLLYMISTTDNYNVLTNPHLDIDTNLTKLIKVLNNCKNSGIIFNYISTWFVYGDSEVPAREGSPCNPRGFYSITKKCAEDLVISFCKTFDIKYKILRLGNVYGTNDKNVSKKKNALGYLTNEIKNNRDINLYFNGNFIRDYIHVSDACRAIKLCIEKGEVNSIYNISNGVPLVFKDLINYIISKTQSTSKITPIDQPKFHKIAQIKDMYLNSERLFSLGYKPKIDIFKGLNMLCK